ncbi:Uma2 family endonuclease [Actinomadura bangladeshensis]|uniref:Uma2 family endonuclease n=1 Tax=Actinomadura bangladeshensis TaxID=453573 RepID=A0A4R4NJD1_9ACTN|nr:Uma2 family endonuclease [Actinomadura bangladeshensis]TDC07780.1 Uma2 family endonuclease [Actinomadura bangladeshensis]
MRAYDRLRPTAIAIMEQLDAYGVELDDQGVHVMTSPVNRHELAIAHLRWQLERQLDPGVMAHAGTPEIDDPATGRLRRPDLVVIPLAALERPGRSYLRPEDVELVAEVVSSPNPENDYERKTVDYPAMGIPTYVIIDPRKSTVTVFSEPGAGPEGPRYNARRDYVFGDQITAGGYAIDSGAFLPYEDD